MPASQRSARRVAGGLDDRLGGGVITSIVVMINNGGSGRVGERHNVEDAFKPLPVSFLKYTGYQPKMSRISTLLGSTPNALASASMYEDRLASNWSLLMDSLISPLDENE